MTPRLVLAVLIAESALSACSCIEAPQKTALRGADAVFQGKAMKVEHMRLVDALDPVTGRSEKRPPEWDDHTIVTFEASKAWKGRVTATMKVYAVVHPSLCNGYKFQEGKEYVVYVTDDVNQDWDKLRPFKDGPHVYGIGICPLRIRPDVAHEAKMLGASRSRTPR